MDQTIENRPLDEESEGEIEFETLKPDSLESLETKVESVIGPPQEIRKRGRPRAPRPEDLAENEERAEQIREARRLPPIPGPHCNFNQMNEWGCMLTEDHWSHVAIYQYRTYPVIVRQLADEDAETNIDKLVKDHFDNGLEEYIRITHGGGRYKFLVKDLDIRLPKGGNKTIMEATLHIPIDDCMPKLNLAELDRNHKINVGYINLLVSRGVIDTKGNPVQPQPTIIGDGGANTQALAGMMKDVLSMFMSMNKEQQGNLAKIIGDKENNKGTDITQLLLEKLKQEDPNKQFNMLSTLLKEMREMVPAPLPPKDDSAMWQMLIKMQNESNEKQMALMAKIIEMKSAPPPSGDGDSWIDKMLKYKEALPGLFGGSTPEGKKSTAELIIDGVKELGLPVIGIASQIFAARGFKPIVPVTTEQAEELVSNNQPMSRGVRQPSQSVQQENRKILSMPTQSPQPSSTQSTTIDNAGDGGISGLPDGAIPLPADRTKLSITQQVCLQFGGMLVTSIRGGMSGLELGERLHDMTPMIGQDVYTLLKAQGHQVILGTIKGIPEMWNQLAPMGEEHINKIIDDFLHYEERLVDDEDSSTGGIIDPEDEGELPHAT